MHNAFLNIDNKKMSKSEGNFFTVRDISEKYDLQILRFFMLNAHYRSPLNFSAELMEAAKNSLERILTGINNLRDNISLMTKKDLSAEEKENIQEIDKLKERFDLSMDDDFNTADAISIIFELVKLSNITISKDSSIEYSKYMLETIIGFCDVLGIITDKKEEVLDADVEKLIEERKMAKKAKDFARADAIREELKNMRIALEDTREGVKWKRI